MTIVLIRLALAAFIAGFSIHLPVLAAGPAPILIGQAIDLSGPNASVGRDYAAGIKTYFDMINSAGGIDGRKLSYVVRDDQGLPEQSAQLASELIERERVDYLIGGIGDEVVRRVVESTAFRRSSHVLYAPLAAAGEGQRVLFWRPSYVQETAHVLNHFATTGVKRLALVVQDSPSAEAARQLFVAEAKARGVALTATARIGMNGERSAQEAARIAASRPGFVMVIADTIGTGLFLKEYRTHDAQTFVAGTSLVNLETLREMTSAKAVEWTVFSQVVPNPSSATSLLQIEHLNMMRKYRDEPVSALTLEGFAVAKSLVLAMRRARSGETLHATFARLGTLDLGGFALAPGSRLSSYLDIALFRKGGGLVF